MRRGRWSAGGAEYFITVCTNCRATGLEAREITDALFAEARKLTLDGAWTVRTAVIMRDHVHLLVVLGASMDLAVVMRLFKGRTAPMLRTAGMRWQRGYFDHRVRAEEKRLPVFLYIYLNPYRARLVDTAKKWPGYFCTPEDWAWFSPMTNQGCPFPGWLL